MVCAGLAFSQSIVSVQNAASVGASIPVSSIAPGSLVSLQIIRGGPIVINPDPATTLVRIRSRATGQQQEVRPLQLQFGTIIVQAPADLVLGEAEVTLVVNGQEQLPATVNVVASAFGIFTKGQSAYGPSNSQNVAREGTVSLNQLTNPARPGGFLTVWGTGLGNAVAGEVTVKVAGRAVTPSYAGPSGLAGLDQINVQLPTDVPRGCFVSIVVKVRGSISNPATFAMGDEEGPCKDPFGFSADDLRVLDSGGPVRLTLASLRSEAMPKPGPPAEAQYVRNEAAVVEFAKRDLERVALAAQPLFAEDVFYGCRLSSSGVAAVLQMVDDFDAGPELLVEGVGKPLTLTNPGVPILYLNILPEKSITDEPFFREGTWTIRGQGGRTHASFEAARQLPKPLRWTNREGISVVDRRQGQIVQWANDGYTDDDMMTVTLSTAANNIAPANAVTCRVPASAGEVTLPADLLAQLAPLRFSSLELRLSPRPDRRVTFGISTADGKTERGVFDYSFTNTLRVNVQ